MKIISIGDIHGRQYWKEVDVTKYDKVIFVGDYTDQFPPMTDVEIETNLLEIIELKKNNPDKVVLLLGNHDIQYMFLDEGFGCSGFRPTMAQNLKMIFKHNKDLFQIAHQIDRYLWTHAGVSHGWYEYNKPDIERIQKEFNCKDLADTLNHMLSMKENRLLHMVSRRRGGMYQFGGVTWADRVETMENYLDGYHQIVGHTPINQITLFGDEKGTIRYIDVLNEVYFQEQDKLKAEQKWGRNNDYDKAIREQFPDMKPVVKEYPQITKFYEFEIEHSVQQEN